MNENTNNIGLILEGGGLRGLYTAGVLDAFLDNDINLKYCIGVSAGVCNALSYISKQRGRSKDININYMNDSRYFSVHNLIHTGSIFGDKMMFDTIPHELMPFDYETYESSECKLIAGVTNCETGKPEYYSLKNLRDNYNIVKATSSLPFVSKIVNINGKKYLDGGLSDAIPLQKSIDNGNNKNILVLTQHRAYKKTKFKLMKSARVKYRKYPNLIKTIANRYNVYNDTRDKIFELEKEGAVFVICPSRPLGLGRFEKNTDKLMDAYNLGINDTNRVIKELKKFLDN